MDNGSQYRHNILENRQSRMTRVNYNNCKGLVTKGISIKVELVWGLDLDTETANRACHVAV